MAATSCLAAFVGGGPFGFTEASAAAPPAPPAGPPAPGAPSAAPPPAAPAVSQTPTALLLVPRVAVICPQQPLPPGVEVMPKPGTLTLNRRPAITVKIAVPVDPKWMVMQVDADDVTSAVAQKEGQFVYVPPTDLRPGVHRVAVRVTPAPGQAWPLIEWCFAQRKFDEIEDASLAGELSYTEEFAAKKAGQESPRNKMSGNLHVVGRAADGEGVATTEWNIRYQGDWNRNTYAVEPDLAHPHGVVDSVDVPNFRTVFTYKQQQAELGDITIQESTLIAPSFPRRGIQFKLVAPYWASEGHLFGARPQVDTTSRHLAGIDDENERLWGGSFALSPFNIDPTLLRLKFTLVSGESLNQGSTNIATVSSAQKGTAWGFLANHSSFQNRVRAEAEYAISGFDQAVGSGLGRQNDKAGRARLDLNDQPFSLLEKPVTFRLGGEYFFTGLFYRSITNPGLTTDRQGVNAEGGTGWGPASVTLNGARAHDNVKDLENLPRVFTTVRGVAVALTQPNWPGLTLGATRTNQESVGEPFDPVSGTRCPAVVLAVRCPQVDNVVNTFTGQLSYNWQFLTANAGATKNQTLDFTRRARNNNTLTYNGGLSLNLFEGRLVLSPTITWTETETLPTDDQTTAVPGSSLLTRTTVYTATATGGILPGELTFDGQFSLTDTNTQSENRGLVGGAIVRGRTVTTNAVGRLTWNFEKYLWNYGRQALALRVNWNRVVDAVTPTNDRNDFGVFLILDVLAPFLF